MSGAPDRIPEERLDELREEAERTGTVAGRGAPVAGGPIPPGAAPAPGYYGRPIVKPPVWTWEVPAYLFVGGLAGMAAVVGFAALAIDGNAALARDALRIAVAGALISPLFLTLDLGRPTRFLAMLRVFKWRSAMSVGAWTLVLFTGAAVASALCLEADRAGLALVPLVPAALLGLLLSTYTGVLLAATAIPAWFVHRVALPVHFGLAGLGSAVAALELSGHRLDALHFLAILVSLAETGVGLAVEIHPRGAVDRAHREGLPGALMRTAGALAGPGTLILRLMDARAAATVTFLVAALVSRFGWVAAGRASGRDPAATLAARR